MSKMLKYKGYTGSIEFSEEDGLFYGQVQGIRALVSYEGKNLRKMTTDFHKAVDSYLEICSDNERQPL